MGCADWPAALGVLSSTGVTPHSPLTPAVLLRLEEEAVEKTVALGGEAVEKLLRVAPRFGTGKHPGMLVAVVEDDPLSVRAGPGAAGVPEGVVEHQGGPGAGAELHRAGEQLRVLQVRRVWLLQRLVAPRNHRQVALSRLPHVTQVVADLELQQR